MKIFFFFLTFFFCLDAIAKNSSLIAENESYPVFKPDPIVEEDEPYIDPLSDNLLTCQEFEEVPEFIFNEGIDLGSGHGSKNQVDYSCPKSIGSLDFMKNILDQAEYIRKPNDLPHYCTGSIIHAQWRYYYFALARHGYYPQNFTAKPLAVEKTLHYFREWSYQSPHNRKLYEEYLNELERVKPILSKWYIKNHGVSKEKADTYSNNALNRISARGFGSHSYYWKPEMLVPHTKAALNGDYDDFLLSFPKASDDAKLNSLNQLLVGNKDISLLKKLFASLKNKLSESQSHLLLSNALHNKKFLTYLLDRGLNPNSQNSFNKTPLYYAIQFNIHDAAKILLEKGANVNHQYSFEKIDDRCSLLKKSGRTPLMHAAQHSDVKMLKLLLKYGANQRDHDIDQAMALDYAKDNKKDKNADFLTTSLSKSH